MGIKRRFPKFQGVLIFCFVSAVLFYSLQLMSLHLIVNSDISTMADNTVKYFRADVGPFLMGWATNQLGQFSKDRQLPTKVDPGTVLFRYHGCMVTSYQ